MKVAVFFFTRGVTAVQSPRRNYFRAERTLDCETVRHTISILSLQLRTCCCW